MKFRYIITPILLCVVPFANLRSEILFSNLDQPFYGFETLSSGIGFAAQGFVTGNKDVELDSIRLRLTTFLPDPSRTLTIGDTYLRIFEGTSASVGQTVVDLTADYIPSNDTVSYSPLSKATLEANSFYWLLIGANATPDLTYLYTFTDSMFNEGDGDFVGISRYTLDGGLTFGEPRSYGYLHAEILVSEIPEPVSFGSTLSFLSLGFACLRRRSRAKIHLA